MLLECLTSSGAAYVGKTYLDKENADYNRAEAACNAKAKL